MSNRTLAWMPVLLLLIAAACVGAWIRFQPARTAPQLAHCGDGSAVRGNGSLARGKEIGDPALSSSEPERTNDDPSSNPANPENSPVIDSGQPRTPFSSPRGSEGESEPLSPTDPGSTPRPTIVKPPLDGPPPGAVAIKPAYEALKGALEPAQWEEYWARRGIKTPPAATSTPIAGKIMSRDTNQGVPKATVGLMTLFPESSDAVASLLPVITEFTTDDKGVFSGTVSAPRNPGRDGERLAMFVSFNGERQLLGRLVSAFEPGVKNDFGVFWIKPGHKVKMSCDARTFSGARRAAFTGELDPRRWHPAVQMEVLSAFPAANFDDSGSLDCDVPGNNPGNRQFATLLLDGVFRMSRSGMPTAQAKGETPRAICNIVFSADPTYMAGRVTDADGLPLAGAKVSLLVIDAQPVTTDSSGWFTFRDLPAFETCVLACEHPEYMWVMIPDIRRDDVAIQVRLTRPRIRIDVRATDRATGALLVTWTIHVTALNPINGQPLAPEVFEVNNPAGTHTVNSDKPLKEITVGCIGYMPLRFRDVASLQTPPSGVLEARLAQGRKLDIRPRDYTAVNDASKWFADEKASDGSEPPGIRTYWADQWVEYELDFGPAPLPEVDGGCFDLLLGCTNHGIVDNQFVFKVDILVDEVAKGTIFVKADSSREQTARLKLGAISGKHRVRLVWRNDTYIENQLDANIRYASIKFLEQPAG